MVFGDSKKGNFGWYMHLTCMYDVKKETAGGTCILPVGGSAVGGSVGHAFYLYVVYYARPAWHKICTCRKALLGPVTA